MKFAAALTGIALLAASTAMAAGTKTYQVTGPVLDVTDDMIAVQKGKDRWELSRTPETQVKGELKKGAKVTIQYRMIATEVEAKGEKKKEEPKKAEPKKEDKKKK